MGIYGYIWVYIREVWTGKIQNIHSGRTILYKCHTTQHDLFPFICSRAYHFLLNWTYVLYRRLPIYTKKDQKRPKSLKMAKIQIQRQFWNQFWSLIPKTVSNLNFFHEKWHFLSTKNSVFWHFWVPKIILLVKKNKIWNHFWNQWPKLISKLALDLNYDHFYGFWSFLVLFGIYRLPSVKYVCPI